MEGIWRTYPFVRFVRIRDIWEMDAKGSQILPQHLDLIRCSFAEFSVLQHLELRRLYYGGEINFTHR